MQPVIVGQSQGFSYGGPEGLAFDLASAIPMTMKDATIQGYEFVLRDLLSVGAASRSTTGKNAFVQATKLLVEQMYRSFTRRMETIMFYGRENIGIISSMTGSNIVISAAEWAPGIFTGAEKAELQFYDVTTTTMLNASGSAKITAVDMETRTLTLANVDAGTIAAVQAAITATDVVQIHFKGARIDATTFNEFHGVHAILSNTGDLFGINATSYSLWKASIVDCDAAVLSLDLVEKGVAKAMAKGLGEEEIVLFVSSITWTALLTEMTAKRMYDSSYNSAKLVNGTKVIEFNTPNGTVKIEASIYVKEGYAYLIPPKEFIRVGSCDISFEQPGREGQFFKLLENANGYELRCYTDQALFTARPGICVLFKNFVNAA
jgi:hypothetical protein